MDNYKDAIELLEQLKTIAVEVNDARKQELIDYIVETLWKYEDMKES